MGGGVTSRNSGVDRARLPHPNGWWRACDAPRNSGRDATARQRMGRRRPRGRSRSRVSKSGGGGLRGFGVGVGRLRSHGFPEAIPTQRGLSSTFQLERTGGERSWTLIGIREKQLAKEGDALVMAAVGLSSPSGRFRPAVIGTIGCRFPTVDRRALPPFRISRDR